MKISLINTTALIQVMKGHNYGLCRKCGKVHNHPKGTLGKKMKFKDIEERRLRMKKIGEQSRQIPLSKEVKKEIERLYHEEKLTQREISERFNLHQATISNTMKRLGIKRRPRFRWKKGHKPWNTGLTKETDERLMRKAISFRGNDPWNKGLGNEEVCDYCGSKFKAPPSRNVGKHIFCNRKCYLDYMKEHGAEMVTFPKPNAGELQLLGILKRISPNWRFTGDGSLWIGGKNPDFYDGDHHLVELFGGSWHNKVEEEERIKHFKQYGFDCLVIWHHELRKSKKVENKLIEFMECD